MPIEDFFNNIVDFLPTSDEVEDERREQIQRANPVRFGLLGSSGPIGLSTEPLSPTDPRFFEGVGGSLGQELRRLSFAPQDAAREAIRPYLDVDIPTDEEVFLTTGELERIEFLAGREASLSRDLARYEDRRSESIARIEEARTSEETNFEQTNTEERLHRWELTISNTEQELALIREEIRSIVNKSLATELKIKIQSSQNAKIGTNALNDYINVQYNVKLSMIPEREAIDIQRGRLPAVDESVDDLRQEVRASGTYTIAATGDTAASISNVRSFPNTVDEEALFNETGSLPTNEELAGEETIVTVPKTNYYNIQSFTINNVYAPSRENPLLSTMTDMKMSIVEPLGFKFHEDIRNISKSLGYTDINPGRIIYRVDIIFSGYNQDTGQWVEQIPFNRVGVKRIDKVSYYVAISSSEAKVTPNGTEYDLSMVPYQHFAFRPEDFVLEADKVFTSDSDTFGSFLINLEKAINEQKETRTAGQIHREYKFYAPAILREAQFYQNRFKLEQGLVSPSPQGGGGHIYFGRDTDIMTLLQAALADLEEYQDLFLADRNNDDFTTPRIHFTVRFNTIYGDINGNTQANPDLYDYDTITYEYIVEPYLTFKKGTVTPENVASYIKPSSQIERIKQIIRFGMLSRVYNYIFTAENTEVLDFDIDLKTFYFAALNTPYDQSGAIGVGVRESRARIDERRTEIRENRVTRFVAEFDNSPDVDSTIEGLFGDIDQRINEIESTSTRFEVLGGGFNETSTPDLYGSIQGMNSPRRADFNLFFDDYLRNDLLTLNDMSIRGDPIWLLSSYATDSIETVDIDSETEFEDEKIIPHTDKLIFLRMFAPNQDDIMNPTVGRARSYPNIIGGFYQVTDVKNIFEGGKFTQKLNGVKLNHLNYVEEFFSETASVPETPPRVPSNGAGIEPRQQTVQEIEEGGGPI